MRGPSLLLGYQETFLSNAERIRVKALLRNSRSACTSHSLAFACWGHGPVPRFGLFDPERFESQVTLACISKMGLQGIQVQSHVPLGPNAAAKGALDQSMALLKKMLGRPLITGRM